MMMNSEEETNEMMGEMDEMMTSLNTCVDVEEIQDKVEGFLFSLDPAVLDNPDDMTSEEQVDLLNQLLSLLAPEGQSMCTDADLEQVKSALEHLGQCDGLESLNDPAPYQDIQDACSDMTALSSTPDDACMEALMDVMLGDNLYGDLSRHVYHNIREMCGCVTAIQSELPDCTMTLADMVAATKEPLPETFDPAYLQLQMSTTVMKQVFCILGLGCDMLIEIGCGSELEALDICLVALLDSDNGGEAVPPVCDESALFAVPPQLSQGLLPDICLEDSNSDEVAILYKSYFEQIYPDFVAVGETTTTNKVSESNAKVNDSTISTAYAFGSFIAAAAVAAVAFMMIRRRRRRHRVRSTFAQVSHNEITSEDDLGSFA
jgi:hypothetical protein